MERISFCSVGDLVVDIYPKSQSALLGGTALYSTLTASQIDATTSIISAVGTDQFVKHYQDVLKKNSINTNRLNRIHGSTSNISITLDAEGKPHFSDWNLGVLKKFHLTDADQKFLKSQGVVRTALFKSFERVFEQVYQLRLPDSLKVADFSGGSMYSNEKEILEKYSDGFDIIAKSITEKELTNLSYYEQLAKKSNNLVLLTAGKKGSVVFTKTMRFDEPVKHIISGNTTGAGDVYISAFSVTYKQTENIMIAMEKATKTVSEFLKSQRFRYTIDLPPKA